MSGIERILALDVGRSMGFAVDGDEPYMPLLLTRKLPASQAGAYGPAFLALADALREIIAEYKPDLIVYEAPPNRSSGDGGGSFHNNAHTIHQQHGRSAIIELVAAEFCLPPCEDAHVATIRKHFVGHGRPRDPKLAVYARCKQLGWRPPNDDAADAAAVWSYFKSVYQPFFGAKVTPLMMRAGA